MWEILRKSLQSLMLLRVELSVQWRLALLLLAVMSSLFAGCAFVVKTDSQNVINDILTKKKGVPLSRKNCGLEDLRYQIFIDEDILKDAIEIFKAARGLKGLGYKYVWIKNRTIYVRKTETSSAICVTSFERLRKLRSQTDAQ